jgi:hypothetical protein
LIQRLIKEIGGTDSAIHVFQWKRAPRLRERISMHPLDPVPAVRRLETDNDQVFAIEIVGQTSAADAENLFCLLEGAYALHERIDVLVRQTDYESADWGEIDPQTMAEGRDHAERHIRRCAVVGGPDWTGRIGGFFTPDVPVTLRYFQSEEEAEAWLWLGANKIPENI